MTRTEWLGQQEGISNIALIALVAILCAAFLSGCQLTPAPAPEPASPNERLALEDCQLAAPGLSVRVAARCGAFTVAENRSAESGRQIDLFVAIIPAISRNPEADPLVFLSGGPGQAATESYVALASAFQEINRTRDILLLDQRGTGKSHPLRCHFASDEQMDDLDKPAQEAVIKQQLSQCLADLDADVRQYTTSIAADDLDEVRAALGYDKLNLYGVSYGTRMALTYLRRHPEHVRTLTLDGIVSPQAVLGESVATDAQAALDTIFQRCTNSQECAAAFPTLRQDFSALLTELATQPLTVTLTHPISATPTSLPIDKETVALTVRMLSYMPETAALLPLLIHTAQVEQDLRPLASQSLMVGKSLSESISQGVNLSVICAEDAPFFTAQGNAASEASYYGALEIERIRSYCSVWPRGEIPADFRSPFFADTPTLLLSGEVDPVTPPANGDQVAQMLPNSLHLVAPGQGHNVVLRGCIPRLMADFVDLASVTTLDANCVDKLTAAPFFVRFTGPEP